MENVKKLEFFAFSSRYFSVVGARDEKFGQNQTFAGKKLGVCDFGTKFLSFIADLLTNIFGKTAILWKI